MSKGKQEKAFREMLKQAYFDYKDAIKNRHDASYFCHDLLMLEDVARKVFGWTEKQIEINENRWANEWRRDNE